MALVDYSTYTERVTAVVSEVEVVEDEDGDERTYVYVDYQVGQEYFERQPLSGSWSGTPEVGDTFELAFPPGAPEDAVTVSMLDSGTQRVLLWIGIGMIGLGVLLAVGLGIRYLVLSGRIGPEYEPPAKGSGRPIAAPLDPATLAQPWPWPQVVAHLAHGASSRGYRVIDLGARAELAANSALHVIRLEPSGRRRYRKTNVYYDESGRGMNRAAFHRTGDGDVVEEVMLAAGPVEVVLSKVLRDAGWKSKWGGEAIGAAVVAGIGLVGGLVALVVNLAS